MESDLSNIAPAEWQRLPIEAVCNRVTSGGTPSRSRPEFYSDGKWGWVKTKELKDGWIEETEENITDKALSASSAKLLPPNTLLLALYGATVGQLGILRHEMTCNQACCAMIVDPGKADFRFLFYQLLHSRSQLKSLATGAAQQNLSGQLVKSYRLPFPPLLEQQAIACILGSLDDKIELNRRMNRTLEGMARALFKSWFVDFDPVRAKADVRRQHPKWTNDQVSRTACPKLKPEIAALLPDAFEDSELGEIPKGWRVGKIDDAAHINAWTLGRRDALDTIDYVEISEVIRGEVGKITRFIRGEEPSRARRRLKHGDTVLSTVRPDRGSHFLVMNPPKSLIASTGFAVLTPKDGKWAFLHSATTRPEFGQELGRLADGGAYPSIRPEIVGSRDLVLPNDLRLIAVFDEITQPLFLRTEANRNACRSLSALRDTLLPRLISGELRVPDAERIVGRGV